jgi:rhodanese-related sulfurtransferase
MKKKLLTVFGLIFLTMVLLPVFVLSADVPMMTKEQLKAMLENPDLVLFDVRMGSDYFSSDLKIKGAVRPDDFICIPARRYPKGKTFVIYCASPNEAKSTADVKHLIEEHGKDGFNNTNVFVLKGGWEEWLKAGYPTEKK